MKRVVIAEDHKILREGLKALLSNANAFEVVAEAGDGIEAIRAVEKNKPDLLLLDLSMPILGGMSVIKEIRSRFPETKILVLTMHESEEFILEGLQLGANGYCLKDAGRAELLNAINRVLDGKSYLSPGIADKVLEGYLQDRRRLKSQSSWDTLTRREKEVLKLVGEGYRNKDIAEYLFISIKTVEKHRSNIMKKLNIHTVSGLTAYAIEKGLVTRSASAT
jgi:DNA-binding NarL/FixJ family response regulator